ncbi:trans-aconitate 2-methyltransferase [Peristeroidobacter soli]|uniref:trans-aconitate 2-methyltransferase n=1 Tax=Peristeroidobacter soli TaxID=2497877 RepID=UPI00101D69A7|nr:trans-aconitate 2-methyltransferase [Peristeroidobacter soli]
MTWSAKQYSTFEDERTRPSRDLVNAIALDHVATAVDLGCGPGNSTEVLARRYPSAIISGIDSSEDMIDSARRRLPQLAFEVADIATWHAPRPLDVILANASLQWLPDHGSLYPRLVSQLTEGGCLAIQTPDNLNEPAHRIARQVATEGAWANKIGHVTHPERHDARWYYSLLQPICSRVDVWQTTYFHPLQNHRALVEWFKGSALRPFLAPLTPDEQQTFLATYEREMTTAYPALESGRVLLPFPRLFLLATR